jgi:uncharacterized protein (DUF1330 family)
LLASGSAAVALAWTASTSGQERGSSQSGGAAGTAAGAITIDEETLQQFLQGEDEGPIVMLNLLKFKPDGGEAAYARYTAGVAPLLRSVGAQLLYSGEAVMPLIGDEEWDRVALVQYPSRQALIDMTSTEEYQQIHRHREEGLERTVLYALKPHALPAGFETDR